MRLFKSLYHGLGKIILIIGSLAVGAFRHPKGGDPKEWQPEKMKIMRGNLGGQGVFTGTIRAGHPLQEVATGGAGTGAKEEDKHGSLGKMIPLK